MRNENGKTVTIYFNQDSAFNIELLYTSDQKIKQVSYEKKQNWSQVGKAEFYRG